MQPMGNERYFKRSIELLFALQAGLQVLAGLSYPTRHIDKCQYVLLQIFVPVQAVQRFQKHVDSFVLKFIASAGTDNQRIIAHIGSKKFIGHVQHQRTGTFAFTGEGRSLRYEIVLEAIHQHYVCCLIQQLFTLVISDFAYCRKAVDMMCGLLLNRVLRLHIQFLGHLVTIIGKQIII